MEMAEEKVFIFKCNICTTFLKAKTCKKKFKVLNKIIIIKVSQR